MNVELKKTNPSYLVDAEPAWLVLGCLGAHEQGLIQLSRPRLEKNILRLITQFE